MKKSKTKFLIYTLLIMGLMFAYALSCDKEDDVDRSNIDGNGFGTVERPFTSDSWWNVPLPDDAPVHPDSDKYIAHIKKHNSNAGKINLSGTDGGGLHWGKPSYFVNENDPIYDVKSSRAGVQVPSEFSELRIPEGVRTMIGGDYEIVLYDPMNGYCAMLHFARYNEDTHTWTVGGYSLVYLDSNGIHVRAENGDPRNIGTGRGRFGPNTFVHQHELLDGELRRVHKVGIVGSSPQHVWPFIGSDGRSDAEFAPPQGTRFRIKPHINLDDYNLEPQARVIAEALQKYGLVIGDTSGAAVTLKMERNYENWPNPSPYEIGQRALQNIPFDDFEVIEHSWIVPSSENH